MLLKDFKLVKSLDELLALGYLPDDFTLKAFERGAEVGLLIGEDDSAVVVIGECKRVQAVQKEGN